MGKIRSWISISRFSKRTRMFGFVLVFAAVGSIMLFRSFATTPNATEKMGVFRGSGAPDQVAAYETWLGRPVTYALDFLGRASEDSTTPWAAIDNPGWVCGQWANTKYSPVVSAALLPNKTFNLGAGARGDYNAHWKKFAEVMVSRGCADSIIRLGWEFNGGWYSWSMVDQEANFAAYWRQVVTTIRGVPGQQFKFDWCPIAQENATPKVELAYPGDAYVDIIGMDAYDRSPVHTSPQDRWDDQLNNSYGIKWQRDFAIAHGKQISFPEWGLTHRVTFTNLSGEDNPFYIQKMYEWMNDLPASGGGSLAYHSYFEDNAVDGDHRLMLGQFPESAAVFKKLFGVLPSTTITDTVAPAAPALLTATAASQIQVDLAWQASTDNIAVVSYDVYRNGTKVANAASPGYSDTSLAAGTKYDYYVKARDAAGNVSTQSNIASAVTASATAPAPSTTPVSIPFRLNSGATTTYTDPSGVRWGIDQYFTGGGGTFNITTDIAGTDKGPMYQSERWGLSSYNIPLNNGTYLLRLHFAEINPASGQRIFNVNAEGTAVLTNYDIAASVGNYTATSKDFTVTVADGILNIGFVTVKNAAKISGLEILPVPEPAVTTTTKIFNGTLSKYGSKTYSVAINKIGTIKYAVTNTTARYDLTVYDAAGKVVAQRLNTTAPFYGNFNATTTGTYKFKLKTKWWSSKAHTLKVTYPN